MNTPQTPQCFPQGMQPKVMVEEAPTQDAEITTVPAPVEGDEPMRTHTVFRMKQDVVYSVTVQLSSMSENTSSQPAFGKRIQRAYHIVQGGSAVDCVFI